MRSYTFFLSLLLTALSFWVAPVFADTTSPAPYPTISTQPIPPADFIKQLTQTINQNRNAFQQQLNTNLAQIPPPTLLVAPAPLKSAPPTDASVDSNTPPAAATNPVQPPARNNASTNPLPAVSADASTNTPAADASATSEAAVSDPSNDTAYFSGFQAPTTTKPASTQKSSGWNINY